MFFSMFFLRVYLIILFSKTCFSKNAFPKEMLFEESQWFTANYQQVSQTMIDVFKNYTKYLVKSKQLQMYCKNTFNFEKMKYKLDDIVSNIMKDIPKEISLKLPKLKKIDTNKSPKLTLPKLKKA